MSDLKLLSENHGRSKRGSLARLLRNFAMWRGPEFGGKRTWGIGMAMVGMYWAGLQRETLLAAGNCSKWLVVPFVMVLAVLVNDNAFAGRVADVRGTKHNLSAEADGTGTSYGGSVPTRTVKATSESQVCVFCHTPHGATSASTPLWNRQLSGETYAPYTSSSLDAEVLLGTTLGQPAGSSKLCLSCHDGTLAIGSVNVLNGAGSAVGSMTIEMTGTASGVMPSGSGTTTGYTRNLKIDLSNDHPISVTYNNDLALRDGELQQLDVNQKFPAGTGTIIGLRSSGFRPKAPLERPEGGGEGQMQCGTCHDPHLRETDAAVGNQKFLRLNRFQEVAPAPSYSDVNDINCTACHNKQGAAGVWAYSAHANNQVASQTYIDTATAQRDFPVDLPVWKASCLNCHDTHSVSGSRRLLREGTDSGSTPKQAGNAALEETCYQCHAGVADAAITPLTTVPDIKSDYNLINGKHMPIKSTEQSAGTEVHDISAKTTDTDPDCNNATNLCGADFIEQRTKLGEGNLNNRHAECADCHNPHRVVKFYSFAGGGVTGLTDPPDSSGTHKHTDASGYIHTNVASGALRGTYGVEPVYTSADFNASLTNISYDVKRGDPGSNTSTLAIESYVTREYQICMKCHSDYGYSDNNAAEATATPTRPPLPTGATNGLTQAGTNGLDYYTNQAKEFQAPSAHKGAASTSDSGAYKSLPIDYQNNNHRSWHPVMDNTGRDATARGGITPTAIFYPPWSNAGAVGTQTMQCGDCHGSNTPKTAGVDGSVIPVGGEDGSSWGPHGSTNDFVLKGQWDNSTGDGQEVNGVCFKCHDYASYALGTGGGGGRTGFWTTDNGGADGHQLHVDRISASNGGVGSRCDWCHVAVPHGWKNKGLLVNLNDVGAEAGLAAGTEIDISASGVPVTSAYNAAPYYMNARLKVVNFKASGQWTANDCGSSGVTGNGQVGMAWMSATANLPPINNENCATPP